MIELDLIPKHLDEARLLDNEKKLGLARRRSDIERMIESADEHCAYVRRFGGRQGDDERSEPQKIATGRPCHFHFNPPMV
jgi:hypothetical protein